jgi:hypothetical protein
VTNLNDFNLMAANFGLGASGAVGPADWAALAGAVPDPSGVAWAAALLPALARRRRRR